MDGTPLGEYLRARRALVHPEDVGLPVTRHRRVAGLRRDEVALVAGISADYYLRLEQGRERHPSHQVLGAIARALLLDVEASAYLQRIALPAEVSAGHGRIDAVSAQRLLDPWAHAAAIVINPTLDVVAATELAKAVSPTAFVAGANLVISVFDPSTRAFAPGWEQLASDTVAALRSSGDPSDPRLSELVSSLRDDEDFLRLWARHDVRAFTSGTNMHYIDGYGSIELKRQNFAIPGYPGYLLVTSYGEPGSAEERALSSLARVDA
ncbi:helix-turn-helix domain-containing protein [Naasia lichenicola]|uniref:Helix-turn-helix domain-containing protein n=1 Tax=Naasia lichenicola TaxID=2565933 RepID=A0A4S4FRL2_9MICO|nr:helix-turn-helix transcriptional regulator [Naasia lichenicola]THG33300.1 helix-turn-helix domain-containing protein [Naasia lichenicola]